MDPIDPPSRSRPRGRPPRHRTHRRAGTRLRRADRARTARSTCCGPRRWPATTTAQEHYVTAFQFAGGGGAFGSLTPLPGIPSSVEKGGDWTLQRLVRETEPQPAFALRRRARRAAGSAEELMKVRIDALDVTVLRGGSAAVGQWATEHGFRLPPDAPEVLDFYAARSPIFLAAVFDADAAAARGQAVGDGTPVHITIPTDNPWVPLRILALGKTAAERVEADVYLLTDRTPGAAPRPDRRQRPGARPQRAGDRVAPRRPALRQGHGLGADLGAGCPRSASTPRRRSSAFDLAIDASGAGAPSRVMAGLDLPGARRRRRTGPPTLIRLVVGLVLTIGGIGGIVLLVRRRPPLSMA